MAYDILSFRNNFITGKVDLLMKTNYNIHLLRVIAVFAVVVIHSSINTFHGQPIGSTNWNFGNFLYSASRFCVPVFFMISSFLLIKDNIDIRAFYISKYRRLLVPLVFWSLFYYYFNGGSFTDLPSAIKAITTRFTSFHLWFLYAMIGFYFIIPIVSILFYRTSMRTFIFYTVILFIFSNLFMFLHNVYGMTDFPYNTLMNFFNAYFIYAFLGVVIRSAPKHTISMIIALVIAILSVVFIYYSTKNISIHNNTANETFYSYTYPPVVILSICVFYLLSNVTIHHNPTFRKILASVADCSFGIYLIHLAVYVVLQNTFDMEGHHRNMFTPLLIAFKVLCISYILVFLGRKIPVLKKVL